MEFTEDCTRASSADTYSLCNYQWQIPWATWYAIICVPAEDILYQIYSLYDPDGRKITSVSNDTICFWVLKQQELSGNTE